MKAPARSTPRLLALAAMLLVPLAAVVAVYVWKPAAPPPPPPAPSATAATSASAPVEDRTPEILGHILDADGNPVNGATVRLVSPSPPYTVYRDTKTDRGGAFSFPHVAPWRVRVVADHDPDGVVTSAALQSPDGGTTEITLVLSAAGAVRGTVVDADDHPVAGAVLSVEGVPWIVPAATSDEAGAFRIPTVPDEATSLVAVARGYRTARAVLGPRDDQTELVVRVRLLAAAPIDGVVLDADGKPARARVVACEEQPAEARTESGDDGVFQLPASTIGCEAVAEQSESAPSDAASIVEGRRMTLRLKAGGAIEGTVVDERGAGLQAFTVGVESFTPSRGRPFDRTGPQRVEDLRGAFRMEHLAPGTYVLTASAAGLPPARSEPLDVRGGAVTGGVLITLLRGGILTGHVFDEHHAPLAGVDLRFDAVSSVVGSSSDAVTDETGLYRIEGAPAGPLTLRIHKDGFRMKLVSGLRVDSGATLREDVTLTATHGGPGLELGGIGAQLEQTSGGIALRDVFPGDPAGRAGLRTGDRIVRIDGETTQGMSMADVLQRLRGEPGTTVGVAAQRPETGETVEMTIVRGTIVH
ncbi:MAG TPA: carboxypeptidase regulatory-like domain-containing protein [Polyangiaceae bacterium]